MSTVVITSSTDTDRAAVSSARYCIFCRPRRSWQVVITRPGAVRRVTCVSSRLGGIEKRQIFQRSNLNGCGGLRELIRIPQAAAAPFTRRSFLIEYCIHSEGARSLDLNQWLGPKICGLLQKACWLRTA